MSPEPANPNRGWQTYDYLILSYPDDDPFDDAPDTLARRMVMAPVAVLIWMSDADAAMVGKAVVGLITTHEPEIYEFRGNRPVLDQWALKHHPAMTYRWLDRVRIRFADDAAKGWWDRISNWRRLPVWLREQRSNLRPLMRVMRRGFSYSLFRK